MEEQKKEEMMMEENKKKNPDQERKSKLISAILMAFVCVLMMGGGTYAWFTMGNVAKVQSLQLKVASEGKLYIGDNADEAYANKKSTLDWPTSDVINLYPCSIDSGILKKPVYTSDTEVGSLAGFDNDDERKLYVLQEDIYLYLDEGTPDTPGKTYEVSLVANDTNDNGSYFKTTGGSGTYKPEYCARVSFSVDGQETTIYEPNSNGDNAAGGVEGQDWAIHNLGQKEGTHKQILDGTFTNTSGDSESLFTIIGNEEKKVTVQVWFEGTDKDCRNDININTITAQLKFKAKPTT